MIPQPGIDLATRIQRRRDFTAHVTGFLSGAVILAALLLAGAGSASLYIATVLTWATALSFQHFRHVLRGPVTACAVQTEAARLNSAQHPGPSHDSTAEAARPPSAVSRPSRY